MNPHRNGAMTLSILWLGGFCCGVVAMVIDSNFEGFCPSVYWSFSLTHPLWLVLVILFGTGVLAASAFIIWWQQS